MAAALSPTKHSSKLVGKRSVIGGRKRAPAACQNVLSGNWSATIGANVPGSAPELPASSTPSTPWVLPGMPGRTQHHQQRQIDAPAQETYRHRRRPTTTTVAAKAEARIKVGAHFWRTPSQLSWTVGTVQNAAARTPRPARLAFIGLETTGANPVRDCITRIRVPEAEGDQISTWSTLVNPQRPIPKFIQQLNGIRDETVVDAPTFAQVAAELTDRLHGRLFIAHHARFHCGFVRNKYQRLGKPFRANVLCTVRLSRKPFPEHQKHDLDSLLVRHDLTTGDRYDALADARLLWQFWCALQGDRGEEAFTEAIRQQLKHPSLPPLLDSARLDELPESPGVYLFHGDNDALLYVGKSVNLRQRVGAHFASDLREYKEMRLSQEVRRIHGHETVGELGALLLEARLVKECQPIHNRRFRRSSELCSWQLVQVAPGHYSPDA